MRAYLSAAQIPPPKVAGYGMLALQAKPTAATRDKLALICKAFVAAFPKSRESGKPLSQQMITIWPMQSAFLGDAEKDDCEFNLAHYDLEAAQDAIADARQQGEKLKGTGPFLLAWAPAEARGVKDKLVLVGDFSSTDEPLAIEDKFNTWKNKIVLNPNLWPNGFGESLRLNIRDFVDHYGGDALDAIKLITAKKPG